MPLFHPIYTQLLCAGGYRREITPVEREMRQVCWIVDFVDICRYDLIFTIETLRVTVGKWTNSSRNASDSVPELYTIGVPEAFQRPGSLAAPKPL